MKQIMPSNPMYAPPSYEEMLIPKPQSKRQVDEHTKNRPLPFRFVTCENCWWLGGTLIKTVSGYRHEVCPGKG